MAERLFGSNRNYVDTGDFTERYFYQLRGCVVPRINSPKLTVAQPESMPVRKSRREIQMDIARTKVNKRNKRTVTK